jgi:hypothetical protein
LESICAGHEARRSRTVDGTQSGRMRAEGL